MEGHLVDWSCMPRKLIKDSTRGRVPDVHKPKMQTMQNYTPVITLNTHMHLYAHIVLPVSGACRYLTAIWWPRATQKILWTKEIHKTFSTCARFSSHNGTICSWWLGQVISKDNYTARVSKRNDETLYLWNTADVYMGTDHSSSSQNVRVTSF